MQLSLKKRKKKKNFKKEHYLEIKKYTSEQPREARKKIQWNFKNIFKQSTMKILFLKNNGVQQKQALREIYRIKWKYQKKVENY